MRDLAAAAAVALDDGEVGGGHMQISSLLVLHRPDHDHAKRKDARRAGRQGGDPGHTEGLPNRCCGKNHSAAHTGGGLHTGTASHCFKQSSNPPFSTGASGRRSMLYCTALCPFMLHKGGARCMMYDNGNGS